jgi:hypothetical protein
MNYLTDAERFMNYYESNGWMVGRTKMKDWKAALANWSKDKRGGSQNGYQPKQSKLDTSMETYQRVQDMKQQHQQNNNFIDGEIA